MKGLVKINQINMNFFGIIWTIVVVINIVFGLICMTMAKTRERKQWVGFWIGFFFGVFAIIGYLIAGDTSEKRARLIARAIKQEEENKK